MTETTMPRHGQVWTPRDNSSEARNVFASYHSSGRVWVSYTLPMYCPCCQTLLRTEAGAHGCDDLTGWQQWVVQESATCREPV